MLASPLKPSLSSSEPHDTAIVGMPGATAGHLAHREASSLAQGDTPAASEASTSVPVVDSKTTITTFGLFSSCGSLSPSLTCSAIPAASLGLVLRRVFTLSAAPSVPRPPTIRDEKAADTERHVGMTSIRKRNPRASLRLWMVLVRSRVGFRANVPSCTIRLQHARSESPLKRLR